MTIKRPIPLFQAFLSKRMEEVSLEILRSGQIANGPYIAKFESGFGNLIKHNNVVSFHDMTSAIFIALRLAGVGKDDEVITTAYACIATNMAIAQIGAKAVWVDVLPKSVAIDVDAVVKCISSKTKAILLYHVAGYPSDSARISEICRSRGLVFIEDCNNALGATYSDHPVGTHGDFSIFSFYPNRQINATEGGALICKSVEHTEKARALRRFGIDMRSFRDTMGEINPEADITEVGWSVTLNNFCAGLAFSQLDTVNDRISQARINARRLINVIKNLSGIDLVSVPEVADPCYWVLLVLVENRDSALAFFKGKGICVSKLHQRNDVYSVFASEKLKSLPNTSYLQDRVLALPCGWWLQESDLLFIEATLREFSSDVND